MGIEERKFPEWTDQQVAELVDEPIKVQYVCRP
jgi:hypothetical protein